MIRTVVTFERFGEQIMLKLDVAPGNVAGLGDNWPIDLTTVPDGTLIERGSGLVALLQSHQTVRAGLDAVLQTPSGSGPSPLYFHVRASSADLIPWELIYAAPHGFCALDGRWPVGRIARRSEPMEPRQFTSRLNVVAVLSAAARNGRPQLRALADALDAADARAIGVRLHVISGDQEVYDEALSRGATAELIAGTAPALARQITDAKPDLVHVLCHGGGTVAGVRVLAFANNADFDAWPPDDPHPDPEALGSIRLPVTALVDALKHCNPWLVVLGACETALATGHQDGLAVAHEMVSSGIPAVIGMRRLVDIVDTDRFCAAFYPAAFSVVKQALTQGQSQVRTIDWAEALTAPRVVMSGEDPTAFDSWTDPVLYAQDSRLEVLLAAPAVVAPAPGISPTDFATLRGKLDQFRGALANLDPATAHPAVIEELRTRIAALEADLAQAGG
jgi:hypothetical protein